MQPLCTLSLIKSLSGDVIMCAKHSVMNIVNIVRGKSQWDEMMLYIDREKKTSFSYKNFLLRHFIAMFSLFPLIIIINHLVSSLSLKCLTVFWFAQVMMWKLFSCRELWWKFMFRHFFSRVLFSFYIDINGDWRNNLCLSHSLTHFTWLKSKNICFLIVWTVLGEFN